MSDSPQPPEEPFTSSAIVPVVLTWLGIIIGVVAYILFFS